MEDVPEAIKEKGTEEYRAFQFAWSQFRDLVRANKSKFEGLIHIYKDDDDKEKVKIIKGKWDEVAKIVRKIRKEKEQQSQ